MESEIVIETYRNAPYGELLRVQRERFDAMVARRRVGLEVRREWVMCVEHRHVYTIGRHGNNANLLHPEWLVGEGIDVVHIERGGDITYHGPGQLVVYPLIDLARHRLGVKSYVTLLEQAVIDTIAEYGIMGQRVEGATGVWVDVGIPSERKICAIGIKCSRFVAMHGLALNVSTDLSRFAAINPCGFTDRGVTSIEREIGRRVTWDEVADKLTSHLLRLLD